MNKLLRELKVIRNYYWDDSIRVPTEAEIERAVTANYSPSGNVMLLLKSLGGYRSPGSSEETKAFYANHTDIGPVPADVIQQLNAHWEGTKLSNKKAQDRRAFMRKVAPFNPRIPLVVSMFLEGAVEELGTRKWRIKEDCLYCYSTPLLKRVTSDIFLKSKRLSIIQSQDTDGARVLSLIADSDKEFWPSMYDLSMGFEKPGISDVDYVLMWCKEHLLNLQIRYPGARVNKDGYAILHNQIIRLRNKAIKQWPGQGDKKLLGQIRYMARIFGDVQKMKEYNASIRMQYEIKKM